MQDVGGAELPYLYYEGGSSTNSFCPCHRFPAMALASDNRRFVRRPIRHGCHIFAIIAMCDPEKGGLAWDIIAKDLSVLCSAQNIKNHVAVGHSMGATVLTIAAAVVGHAAARHDSDRANFSSGRILLDGYQAERSSSRFQSIKRNKSLER